MTIVAATSVSVFQLLARSKAMTLSVAIHVAIAGAGVAIGAGPSKTPSHAASEVQIEIVDLTSPSTELSTPPPTPSPIDNGHEGHAHPYAVSPSLHSVPHDPLIDHRGVKSPPAKESPVAHEDAPTEPIAPAGAVPIPAPSVHFTLGPQATQATLGTSRGSAVSDRTGDAHESQHQPPRDTSPMHASMVHVAARLIESAAATYPPSARADDVEGDVDLEIVVDPTGRVIDARIVRSAGHGFDASALAAIRRYRFTSARHDGHEVAVRMPWTVHFRLQ